MSKKLQEILTLNEVATYLRLPRSTAYKLAQGGRLPGQKCGRQWRFRKAVIDRWLDNNEVASDVIGERL